MRSERLDLAGKVALVTGGTRGIGRAVAARLASRGCSLLITCSNTASLTHVASLQSEVKQFFDKTSDEPPFITGIVADIYRQDCAREIADALSDHFENRVDIVLLNAAAMSMTFVGKLDIKEFSESLFANVQTNAFTIDELVKRQTFQRDSRIIFMSSIRDRLPWQGLMAYSAGKAAGESMCRTWAEAFGGKHDEVSIS
jgi:3-oxoacyl-[acyl-carrier protein] reductase